MSSVIAEAMQAAIAKRIVGQDEETVEATRAVVADLKSESQVKTIDRKTDSTERIAKLLREEQGRDNPNVDVVEAYQARLEELKKVS